MTTIPDEKTNGTSGIPATDSDTTHVDVDEENDLEELGVTQPTGQISLTLRYFPDILFGLNNLNRRRQEEKEKEETEEEEIRLAERPP